MVMDTRTTQNYNQVTSVTESLQKRGYDVTTGKHDDRCNPGYPRILPRTFLYQKERRLPGSSVCSWQMADPVTLMENYVEYAKVPGIEQHQRTFCSPVSIFRRKLYGLYHRFHQGPDLCQICRFYRSAAYWKSSRKTALLVIRRIILLSGYIR